MGRIQGDLPQRTYRFALLILELLDQLPRSLKGAEVTRQLMASGTSIGANIREADQAASVADFIHKRTIACKEASETHYWLQLCRDSRMITGDEINAAIQESEELIRILVTVLKKSKPRDKD